MFATNIVLQSGEQKGENTFQNKTFDFIDNYLSINVDVIYIIYFYYCYSVFKVVENIFFKNTIKHIESIYISPIS